MQGSCNANQFCQLPADSTVLRAAAARIGKLHYCLDSGPARPGDTWDITVCNVKTCARVDVFIACCLDNSLIDNVQLFGSRETAVFYNGGVMRNIKMQDVHYTRSCRSAELSLACVVFFKYKQLCAVYFHESVCSSLQVRDLTADHSLQAVIGGSGLVELEASGIRRLNAATQLVSGQGIRAKLG